MNALILISAQVVHRFGWCLVHFIWQGSLVAALLAVLLMLLRKRSANIRYLVCFGALLLMALSPVLTYWAQSDFTVTHVAVPLAKTGSPSTPLSAAASASNVRHGVEAIATSSMKVQASNLIEIALPWLCMAWTVGVLILALRNVAAWFCVRGVLHCETLEPEGRWIRSIDTLRRSLGIPRAVRLLESARATVPMAAGILKPVVLLPTAVIAGLTPSQVEAILAHELAHIRRHDYLANLVQVAIETLLFYHPAVWWVSRRVREERENCCDDLAVHATGGTMQYARALATLAQLVAPPPELAVTATQGLLRRIQRLVGLPEKRSFGLAPLFAGLSVVLVLLCSALGCTSEDLNAKVERINIDTATREDLIRVFGTPKDYVWNDKHFDEKNLPSDYIIDFPDGMSVWMSNGQVTELRFTKDNYTFRGKIRVGSSLDDVVAAIGQPTQTVEDQPNGFFDQVLYKDIDGKKGHCYYAREDCAVRIWFLDYKVCAIYVTRSDYTDCGRPPKVPGQEALDLTPNVEKLSIDTATVDDLVSAFGKPVKYLWGEKRLDVNNLPENYIILFQGADVWMRNNKVNELRFYEPNYMFRNKIRVGSTVEDVVSALGQPTETVEGKPNQFRSGVLYRDIDGRKGYCYYAREDCAVRMFFNGYKVSALYVTRSDFPGSRK